jgi:uncharacterized protein
VIPRLAVVAALGMAAVPLCAVAAQPAPATTTASAYSSIAEAARRQDWAAARQMAKLPGAQLNATSSEGSTALHFAVNAGEAAMVRALLDAGADTNIRNLAGVAPLQLAITSGDAALTSMLLAAGADARARDEAKESMLMLAARHADGAAASALLAAGAERDYIEPRYGQDALMIAVRSRNPAVVEALVRAGAALTHQTPAGPAPTIREPGAGGGSTGEGMIRSGVPPEGQRLAGTGQFTALLYAARDGQLEAARLLVKAGANLELAEYNAITPLLMAVSNDHFDIAALLVEAGANVNAADWYGRQPLWSAVESRNRDVSSANATSNGVDRDAALKVISMLLDKGADVNARVVHFPPRMGGHAFNYSYVPTVGETAFYRASLNNDVVVMRMLLARGANPKQKTQFGSTPLMAAAGVGWARGQTFVPGGVPAQLEAVKMLVELGCDVNEANEMGLAPIHGAAFRWSDEVISYLVAQGARLDARDAVGRDALTWASGVTTPSTPPEASPRTMALIQQLLARAGSTTGSGAR